MKKTLIIVAVLLIILSMISAGIADDKANDQLKAKIDELIKQLGADDWQMREDAHRALANIGAPAEEAVKEATKSTDPEVRLRAAIILKVMQVTKRVKFSETFLKEIPDIYRDLSALNTIGKLELLRNITVDAVNDKNQYKYQNKVTNQDIANLIGEVLMDSGKELSIEHKYELIKITEGVISGDIREPIHEASPYIMKLLNDDDMSIRAAAVYAMGNLGAKEAIPEIKKLLNNNDQYTHRAAVLALGTLGVKEMVPEIKKLLDNAKTLGGYGYAAWLLGQFGDKESLPEILELLNRDDWESRSGAVLALGKIGSKENVPQIIPFLKDSNQFVRGYAAISLIELGEKKQVPKELIPDIKFTMQEDPHDDCKNRARSALKALESVEDKK